MPDKQAPVISHGKQAVTESLSIPVFGGARVYFGEIRLLAPSGRTALVLAGILSRTISKKRDGLFPKRYYSKFIKIPQRNLCASFA